MGYDGAASRSPGRANFSLPHKGIIRPFSFSLREVRVRFRGRELRAVHTAARIDDRRSGVKTPTVHRTTKPDSSRCFLTGKVAVINGYNVFAPIPPRYEQRIDIHSACCRTLPMQPAALTLEPVIILSALVFLG